jgi:N-acetylglucosamine kinase-like BadF-type ATPase
MRGAQAAMFFLSARFHLLRERQDAGLRKYYLGVDGGQSSTTALIADDSGSVIGRGRGGPCNHVAGSEAEEKFTRVIGGCLREACAQARLDDQSVRFAAACLGFSGGPEDKRHLSEAVVRSERYHVTHDAEIALTGATAGEPGIIVISGTGSMAFGRDANGRSARAGGWGYIFGDEGGAFDIVRQALRAGLRSEEGWGPATSLTLRLREVAAVPNMNAVLHAFYAPGYPRSKVAALAPLVNEEAERGDAVAVSLLEEAGLRLAELVAGVHRQLFQAHETVAVAGIGGTFASKTLRASLDRALGRELSCRLSEPLMNPAAGALLQALRLDGNPNLPCGFGLSGK